ncbi:hypothetical protein LUZ61_020336 [Rhynchospora tenuis]|uniref:Uncharacterized protein n=1 Tax=Rhynchospora tenuis TaxID=198213 RepID=A0AAD6ENR2_9POAL|nr:hypothetical protein LUZ61_020336 [Rhynchospora tenuis]
MDAADGSKDIHNSLVDKINQHLLKLSREPMEAEKFTIYRVPAHFREKNESELYKPRMISIGPYYHGHKSLQAMEKQKWRYLQNYLDRNPTNNIEHCISKLKGLESQARRCYFEEVELQSDEFLKMMLLDGCFIIEFLMKWYYDEEDVSLNQTHSWSQDSISNVEWVLPMIRNDLLLMENQIPFFIIEKLFSLLSFPESLLVRMLLKYLSEGREKGRPVQILHEIEHILHLYYLCYVPSRSLNQLSTRTSHIQRRLNPIIQLIFSFAFRLKMCFRGRTNSTNGKAPRTIPSATQLEEAGIRLIKTTENIFNIEFQNGTLEIPFIAIEDTRRSRLLNLVSFEQCYRNTNKDLTSYACFMGNLVRTTRDVTLLQEKGIIENLLATNEELVSFFNRLTECSYLDHERHYLNKLLIDVSIYYNAKRHMWRAKLKRDYFSNPWSIISVTAAFALMALTFLQTLYTILSYYK